MLPARGFACPVRDVRLDDCYFYQFMEFRDGEVVRGDWDLRGCVDQNLGRTNFANARVLEIGPASGFLTFEMERRGAAVTAVELYDDYIGDIVPHVFLDPIAARVERKSLLEKVLASFWYAHERMGSRATVYYGDARQLPDLGEAFDIGLLSAVLLHCSDPMRVLFEVAARVRNRIVVVDAWKPWMESNHAPTARFVPDGANRNTHTWWEFSPACLSGALSVAGFETVATERFEALAAGITPYPLYAIVAERRADFTRRSS
jgi:SAM-dependent methyltransferase